MLHYILLKSHNGRPVACLENELPVDKSLDLNNPNLQNVEQNENLHSWNLRDVWLMYHYCHNSFSLCHFLLSLTMPHSLCINHFVSVFIQSSSRSHELSASLSFTMTWLVNWCRKWHWERHPRIVPYFLDWCKDLCKERHWELWIIQRTGPRMV